MPGLTTDTCVRSKSLNAGPATFTILPPYRPALTGLDRASHVIALGWFTDAARDRHIQQPPHLTEPIGALALRSPDRPNPIALSIPRLLGLDLTTGTVTLDALDWFDATPLIDLKPYYPSVDRITDASIIEPRRSMT